MKKMTIANVLFLAIFSLTACGGGETGAGASTEPVETPPQGGEDEDKNSQDESGDGNGVESPSTTCMNDVWKGFVAEPATAEKEDEVSVALTFPVNGSVFYGKKISVSGTVASSKLDETEVVVEISGEKKAGKILDGGAWVACDVPLPDDQSDVEIRVTLKVAGEVMASELASFKNYPVFEAATTVLSSVNPDKLYILERGSDFKFRIFSILLSSGERENLFVAPEMDFYEISPLALVEEVEPKLIYADNNGAIHSHNLFSGSSSILSSYDAIANPVEIGRVNDAFMDTSNRRLLILDADQGVIVSVNLEDGRRDVLSGGQHPGVELQEIYGGLAVDVQTLTAFVATDVVDDDGKPEIVKIDLQSGSRSVLAEDFGHIADIVYDPANGRLVTIEYLVANKDQYFITTLDPESGAKTYLDYSDDPEIEVYNPDSLTYDAENNRYLFSDIKPSFGYRDNDALISVSAVDGARSVLFQERIGEGDKMSDPKGVEPYEGSRVFTYDIENSVLYDVDLDSGDKVSVASVSEEDYVSWGPMTLDPDRYTVYLNNWKDRIVGFNLMDSSYFELDSGKNGVEPGYHYVRSLSFNNVDGYLYVLDGGENIGTASLVKVDPATNKRELVSGGGKGKGVNFISPIAMTLEKQQNRIVVIDEGTGSTDTQRIFRVDIATGNREVIYSEELANGYSLNSWSQAIIPVENRDAYLVQSEPGLIYYDASDASYSTLMGDEVGNGERIGGISGMYFSATSGLLYMTADQHGAIFAVDPKTGDRVIVSK